MKFVYKGLKAELKKHTVTEAELELYLQRLVQQNPRVVVIQDRPTQPGDEVILDYAGFCDGKQFDGGTAQNQSLVLGSGMFIPGFEEQLVGKNVEENVTVEVTFPEGYHAKELAGKKAEFRCVIHEIHVKSARELDDAFAREVGGCKDLADMRRQVRANLQSYTDEKSEMELQDRLLRKAAATLEFSVSKEVLEKAVEEQIQAMQAQLAQQGLTLEMYCAFMKTTVEDFRRDAKPAAEAALRNHAAIEKIVALEGLQAEEAEMQAAYALVCRQNGMTMEQLQPHMDEAFRQAVTKNVLTSKVMRLIRDAAEVTVAE